MLFKRLQQNWSPYLWWLNWHPAEKLLPSATAAEPGTIILRTPRWKTAAVLRGHSGGINASVWDPRGERLLTAAWDGSVRLWDRCGCTSIAACLATGSIESAFWSPDGKTIAAIAHDGAVHLLDESLDPALRRKVDGPLYHGCFSRDGKSLFAAGQLGLFRIDIATGETVLIPLPGGVVAVALPPGGGALHAVTGEGAVIRATGRAFTTVYRHASPGRGLALSADGRIAAGFADGRLVILGESGKVEFIHSFKREATALTWCPRTGQLFAGTRGGLAGLLTLS